MRKAITGVVASNRTIGVVPTINGPPGPTAIVNAYDGDSVHGPHSVNDHVAVAIAPSNTAGTDIHEAWIHHGMDHLGRACMVSLLGQEEVMAVESDRFGWLNALLWLLMG